MAIYNLCKLFLVESYMWSSRLARALKKYHIESRVSTTLKLREKATKKKDGTSHKDGLDYFKKDKFEHSAVLARRARLNKTGISV